MCIQCSTGLPIFPYSSPAHCVDCYFAKKYCQLCMCYNTCNKDIFPYVCEDCEDAKKIRQKNKCKRAIWNNSCNLKPQFPLLYPTVCHKHFTKNIRTNLVAKFSKLRACCRCGSASSSICFEVYCTPKYSGLRVCERCALGLTLAIVKKHMSVGTLVEIVVTFLFSSHVFFEG